MRIDGYYLDGKTSKRHTARLEAYNTSLHDLCIHVEDNSSSDEGKIQLAYNDLKIETRLGNTPREIAFLDNRLFVTSDNDGIDELIKRYSTSNSHSRIHLLETNLPLILVAVITTVIMIWAVVTHGIPKSAEYIAFKLPAFTTENLGSSLSVLDETLFEPSQLDEKRQQSIRELTAPYLASFEELNPKLEFRSGMQANAFALPGGEIVLTDDFVNLVENDEQLLAVLLHEIGHLKHKHIIRRALQDSMLMIIIIFVTGDIESADFITGIPTLILDLSYSREFEREADSFALEQMQRFDIPVENFAVIMQRLEQFYTEDENSEISEIETKLPHQHTKVMKDFLSTHPSTDERVKLVEKFKSENHP